MISLINEICFSMKQSIRKNLLLLSALIGIFTGNESFGVSVSRPVGNESRIRVINYAPNSVIRFVGHYNYHSIIEFAQDEEIKTITMGESTGWQLNPAGNRIFLKPIGLDATTNMTVITSRRTYFFEMHAEHASSISDSNLAFITKFMYPDGQLGVPNTVGNTISSGVDLSKPGQYNFKYRVSGNAKHLEPLLIFDDGKFTYFKFKDVNADIPAIFIVDQNQNEALINYRVSDGYVVIERVTNKFTLRSGKDIICVFNEKNEVFIPVPKVGELSQQSTGAAIITQPGINVIKPN